MKNILIKFMQQTNIACQNYLSIKTQTILKITSSRSMRTCIGISNQISASTRFSLQRESVAFYSTDKFNGKIPTQLSNEDGKVFCTRTPVQEFYNGRSVFITGGTGFLGKIVIQVLLKNCSDVNRIYMLIREKKGKSSNDRIKDFLKNSIFNSIKDRRLEDKIIGIPGDCSREGLGLSENDRELLKNEISVVMHLAASVRFDDNLKDAAMIHLRGTSDVADLCKEMPNLKAFLHCSTAYACSIFPIVEEKVYNHRIKYNEVLKLVNDQPDEIIDKLTPKFIKPFANTYVFCKALGEEMVREKCANLPTGIIRPGAVSASLKEPEPGWIDNYNAATAVIASIYAGTMRTTMLDPNKRVDIVPVDMTANAVITGAWDISRQNERRDDKMLIYNYTTLSDERITWGDCIKKSREYAIKYPSNRTIWYPMILVTSNIHLYRIYDFFLQALPSIILDSVARIRGHKPRHGIMSMRMRRIAELERLQCINDWEYKINNLKQLWRELDARDRELFPLFMHVKWSKYLDIYMAGIRKFLFKDDLSTLELNRKKITKYYWINQSIKLTVSALLFYILYGIFI